MRTTLRPLPMPTLERIELPHARQQSLVRDVHPASKTRNLLAQCDVIGWIDHHVVYYNWTDVQAIGNVHFARFSNVALSGLARPEVVQASDLGGAVATRRDDEALAVRGQKLPISSVLTALSSCSS